ncbi:acyltransferase family protein [Terracidiphilus gabretensis]|uniref:acyltransferase family protein n=1 Tax=Terracidiphilus gabretensis TaxID=1577687 RepID=UPI00071BD98A|nr:acyltransferase family protein [Terracidiphilus gabretensis]
MVNMVEAPLSKRTLDYRPDIDGLRAVAVLSVIAFHVGILHISGGFIGVDVFFVISGYLISSIVFAEIAQSRFSVVSFYERRIRRIFPALLALFFGLTVFAAVFLLPSEIVDFSKSLLAATLSVSNFYFWGQAGYFDHRNASLLLHTWSLAVEEQFYILFPIFLVIVRRLFPRRLRLAVIILFLVSLASSVITVSLSRDTAFYMPYTRAWELLTGTLLSLGVFPKLQSVWSRNLVAFLGIGMIFFACRFYSPLMLFPGLSALLPCIGCALIIGAGVEGRSIVYSVLAWRPFVFLGLISYSLYLWHWPVIMVYRMGIFDFSAQFEHAYSGKFAPDRFDHILEIGVSLILAILSWRFVEQPFRKGRLRFAGSKLFALAAATMLCFVAFSVAMIGSNGWQVRFSQATLRPASFLDKSELQRDEQAQRLGSCFLEPSFGVTSFDYERCLAQNPSQKNYLLLGDSHAAAIWPALKSSFSGVNVMQVNVAACPPVLHHDKPGLCKTVMEHIFQSYLPSHRIDGLILEADWLMSLLPALDDTLAWAKQHQIPVIVIGCVPEYDAPLARLVAYSVEWNKPELPGQHRLGKDAQVEQRLRALVQDKWHLPFISIYDALCDPAGKCVEFANEQQGIPLMDDSHHLNRFGAHFAIQRTIDLGQWNQVSAIQPAK